MQVTDVITPAELREWNRRSDWQGARMVASNWLMIAAIFAGVALWTHPLTILLGVLLLGGRQLGCAALMHDAGHGLLFRNLRLNDFAGQWLAAGAIMVDMRRYAAGHRQHHREAGTQNDPDLPNYRAYPIQRESFRRKIVRDLSGQTGWKLLRGRFRGRDGLFGSQLAESGVAGFIVTSLVMIGVLAACGRAELYLMWPAAFLTSYMLFARLRQVAEHGGVPDLFDRDPRKNTRTTYARWWERMFLAPHFLNYHLEHHLAAGVPCYRLRALHQLLKARGAYGETHFPVGYGEVLRGVVLP